MIARSNLGREIASLLISASVVLLLLLIVVVPAHSQVPVSPPNRTPELIDDGAAPVAMIVILIAQFVILVSLMTMYLSREAGLKPLQQAHPHHWWQHIHVHH